MKRNWLIFAVLWILSLVGISCYGGAVSYGLFAMLTILPGVCVVYLLCVFFFFRIYQEIDSRHLVANHSVPFLFTLMNEMHFGFVGIRVRFYSSFSSITGLDDETEYELLPMTGINKQTDLLCKYRGEYEVGIKQVELQDYFRLVRMSYHNREALRVIVKPDLIDLEGLRRVDVIRIMARDSRLRQTDPDILVRAYEPGDDVRRMHWAATARSASPMIRTSIGQQQEGISILMGTCRCSNDPKDYLPIENKMLEATLALAMFFAKKRIPVRTFHLGTALEEHSVQGLEQFDRLYETLAGVEFREERSEELLLTQMSANRKLLDAKAVFLILHEWTPHGERLRKYLSENNVQAFVYLIADIGDATEEQKFSESVVTYVSPDDDLKEVM